MGDPGEGGDERELVERAKGGDLDAFGALVARYQDRVYAVAYGVVRHPDDALDLAQEAFARAFQSLQSFRGEARFSSWIHRIVVNLALDHLRRGARKEAAPFDDRLAVAPTSASSTDADPSVAVERQEIRERLRLGVAALPPEQRATLLLREVEGLSYREIARAMGCSIGTVMSRLHYARRKLREALAPYR